MATILISVFTTLVIVLASTATVQTDIEDYNWNGFNPQDIQSNTTIRGNDILDEMDSGKLHRKTPKKNSNCVYTPNTATCCAVTSIRAIGFKVCYQAMDYNYHLYIKFVMNGRLARRFRIMNGGAFTSILQVKRLRTLKFLFYNVYAYPGHAGLCLMVRVPRISRVYKRHLGCFHKKYNGSQ